MSSGPLHLHNGGTSVILDFVGSSPRVEYWGTYAGELSAGDLASFVDSQVPAVPGGGIDEPLVVGIHPAHAAGWFGRPGVEGHRAGGNDWSPSFTHVSIKVDGPDGRHAKQGFVAEAATITSADRSAGLTLVDCIEVTDEGLVRVQSSITNTGPDPFELAGIVTAFPVPEGATQIIDFAGRWTKERTEQRTAFSVGMHLREGRRGRTGHDSAFVLCVGEEACGYSEGEVWGLHVAHSGNNVAYAERVATGQKVVGAGELLQSGEVTLETGATYTSPWVYFAHAQGLDALAAQFHRYLRSHEHAALTEGQLVTLNVWEAVYFEHDYATLARLAEIAASIGVERFVVDDGWFRGRRDDTSSLGDWYVDEEVWGDRLAELSVHVRRLGMEFGLWFEPEMISLNSDLAHEHPDWILGVRGRRPIPERHQYVLDLSNPRAYAWLVERIGAVISYLGVSYIKWDHNRDLIDAASPATGQATIRNQTRAVYRLMDAIKAAHPGLLIESCASGGARIDLGILEHTDRVWASDCIDPHERVEIQMGTMQLCPPELLGSHVGAPRSHTTGRTHDLSFRATVAMFASFGIEWNLLDVNSVELADLAAWVDRYKEYRGFIARARIHRAVHAGCLAVIGAVAPDKSQALYGLFQMERPATWPLGAMRLPGLDTTARYKVELIDPIVSARGRDVLSPWMSEPIELPGALLVNAGIRVPLGEVDQSAILRATRMS